jgi:predicted amidophosphoribosyltransferase
MGSEEPGAADEGATRISTAPSRCPACGEPARPGLRFCEACGQEFGGESGGVVPPAERTEPAPRQTPLWWLVVVVWVVLAAAGLFWVYSRAILLE